MRAINGGDSRATAVAVQKFLDSDGNGKGSWVLFVDLVKAFDTVPWDVLFVVLAKLGVPPHLISVIKRMNTDLQVTFDLNGEPYCQAGVPAQPDPLPLRDAGRA